MDTQDAGTNRPETKSEIELPEDRVPDPIASGAVSDDDFEAIVNGALEAVGGTLLFRQTTGKGEQACHAAAAVVGLGEGRQFLLLTLPVQGGQLKVEPTSQSENPLARIAESYASVLDVLKAAA